jgi:hypothetical protein
MIVLYNKGLLYAKAMMNLRIKMNYNGRVFDNKKQEGILLLPEEVMHILQRNGDIKIWNGNNYVKLNLGQFYDIMQNKKYNVVDYVEPKKEVVQPKQEKVEPKKEVKQEEVKVEPKKEVVQPKQEKVEPKKEVKQEEVKVEPKKEEIVVEEKQEIEPKKEYDNKKQRHNKQQGGDK